MAVSKEDLNDYEFQNMEDYFNYVVDSRTNGQHNQARQLIKRMSRNQKKDFISYLYDVHNANILWANYLV